MEDLPNRFPLPMAYGDPAFASCVTEAMDTMELMENFDRLRGTTLTSGKPTEADMRAFVEFVHDTIYMRLPDDALHAIRAAAMRRVQSKAR
jgi:hypothetical protein